MEITMRRREFMMLFDGAAAWPLARFPPRADEVIE
jgi:hypothetical protein